MPRGESALFLTEPFSHLAKEKARQEAVKSKPANKKS
jgi:hypothetical protein